MECSLCGGYVEWKGPITALTHTECHGCGAVNSQTHEDEECRYCSGSGAIYIEGESGAWEEPCPECTNPPIGIISLHNRSKTYKHCKITQHTMHDTMTSEQRLAPFGGKRKPVKRRTPIWQWLLDTAYYMAEAVGFAVVFLAGIFLIVAL
jgi:hypothetical protein